MSTQHIPTTAIEELNATYKTDLQFKNENERFVYLTGKIENPLPTLFKEIELEVRWSKTSQVGWVSYDYSHPNGGHNGYSLGMIIEGKYKS
jgi:hypothetical protein